ncbi:MAG TPA: cytochrome c [Flavobacteriales bacterium]|nr:cytochrome c [Flavobacteriales bacterium]
MKLGSTLMPLGIALLLASCGGESQAPATDTAKPAEPAAATPAAPAGEVAYPAGFITAESITPPVGEAIDQGMVDEAMKIFNAKCKACHGLTEEKVVGPGWKGVIHERKPEWIMNMMLHTQWMVENDPAAQQLVEETKTVMPDQELTEAQARNMLELIRSL